MWTKHTHTHTHTHSGKQDSTGAGAWLFSSSRLKITCCERDVKSTICYSLRKKPQQQISRACSQNYNISFDLWGSSLICIPLTHCQPKINYLPCHQKEEEDAHQTLRVKKKTCDCEQHPADHSLRNKKKSQFGFRHFKLWAFFENIFFELI